MSDTLTKYYEGLNNQEVNYEYSKNNDMTFIANQRETICIKDCGSSGCSCKVTSNEPPPFMRPLDAKPPNLQPMSNEDFEKVREEIKKNIKTPAHYDNSKGSLYKFAHDHDLNFWESDAIKRIVRCRKKGQFLEDIDKTIEVLKLYKKEYKL